VSRRGGGQVLVPVAMGVAVVTVLVGTLAVAAGLIWLTALAWSGTGAAGGALVSAGRRRPQPELRLLMQSTYPPGRVTCRHHNLVAPWLVAAECAACGPLDAETVHPDPVYGGL
jgi:hypothetical protein